jgi:hypothetical protein
VRGGFFSGSCNFMVAEEERVLIWFEETRLAPESRDGVMSRPPFAAKLLLDRFMFRFGVAERQSLFEGLDLAV